VGVAIGAPRGDEELVSADLSTASDLLEFDVCEAVWNGLYRAGVALKEPGWTKELYRAGKALFSEHLIVPPNDKDARTDLMLWKNMKVYGEILAALTKQEGQKHYTQRGAPMGLGTTWPILSIVQGFAAQQAMVRSGNGERMSQVRICGDDLIARWHPKTTEAYFRIVEDLGLKINRTKTIRSKTGGVFVGTYFRAEVLKDGPVVNPQRYGLHPDTKVAVGHRYLRELPRVTLSALLLAKRKGQKRKIEEEHQQLLPILGDCIRDATKSATHDMRNRALEVVRWFWSSAISRMEKSGLPVHLPQEFGGWGMPGRYKATVYWRKAIANWLSYPKAQRPNIRRLLQSSPMGPLEETARKMAGALIEDVETTDRSFSTDLTREEPSIEGRMSQILRQTVREQYGSDEDYKATGFRLPGDHHRVLTGYVTGLDKKAATLQLQLKLAGELRSSLTGKSGQSKEEEVPLQEKARRVKNIMRKLYSMRPGINPVNLTTLQGRRGNRDVTLVDLRSLGRTVSDLGLDGPALVARFVRETDVVTPSGVLTVHGEALLQALHGQRDRLLDVPSADGGIDTTTPTPEEVERATLQLQGTETDTQQRRPERSYALALLRTACGLPPEAT
jgi:hypothetical protein